MSTLVIYSDAVDGYIQSEDLAAPNASYDLARAGTGAYLNSYPSFTFLYVGQDFIDSVDYTTYDLYESFLSFDTSSIGSGATISATVLNLTSTGDYSTTDFTLEARLDDWGTGLTTADWISGANLSGKTLLAHYATSGGWTTNSGYDLVDDAFPANVNKIGSTRILLDSSRMVSGTAPTGSEYVVSYSADQAGTTKDPKLTVTYTVGSENHNGSFLATGSGVSFITDSTQRNVAIGSTASGLLAEANTTSRNGNLVVTGSGLVVVGWSAIHMIVTPVRSSINANIVGSSISVNSIGESISITPIHSSIN